MSDNGNIPQPPNGALLEHSCAIVAAYVGNNPVPFGDVSAILRNVHAAIADLAGSTSVEPGTAQKPAISIRKSVTPDHIVCLEDGKKLKMLKRYLRSRYDLSPEQYRAKWGLTADYPLVAPNYAQQRSVFAKKIGLGKTPGRKTSKKRKRA